MIHPVEPTKGRFRGEEIDLDDAGMMLTEEELTEVEVTVEDGTVTRPWKDAFKPKDGPPERCFVDGVEYTVCYLDGVQYDVAHVRAQLSENDMTNVVIVREDRTTFRPWREAFNVFSRDKDGILSF